MDTIGPHVLIVDDTFVDRLVASRVLKTCNIQVTMVEGPKQALDFLDVENDVNLILTDYCMPGMTGYDLLMEVKESPKLKHIPVVVMSSDHIPQRMQKCMDAGAKEYIIKPIKAIDVPRILSYI
ncbi:Two-component response regulator ORR12 [Zea mays]|uniref:Two-component response regulator ARR16 n=2 Tax=Zea mays TaxID=4577 RepID=A0A1D6KQE2_MAIZE|nr:two-component response regulator ORR12 [Zea mays]ONM04980.1 Two-component response regulator ARR16 [Zea mays]PWZ56859.1 Two-component response regulator ORR12 [Zea mays]|eukprot:XP_008664733.1 two-component response regulator ORR12 [Zea mays]